LRDTALSGRPWSLGHEFSVADINLAAIAALAKPSKVSLNSYTHLRGQLNRAPARPAYSG
jgi:glutathione S-transferase